MTMKYTKFFFVMIFLTSSLVCSDKEVSQGCNDFACNMYQQLKKESGNLFFSPYSITTALSAAYAGARGLTEAEMSNVLCDSLSQEEFHPAYASTIDKLNQDGSKYQLEIANKVFVQNGYKILDSFEQTIKTNYGAAFDVLDFVKNPLKASGIINGWVYEKTHEKIKDIVSPDMFNDDTRMVIANAIYFKGKWAEQFEKSYTKPKPFYISENDTVKVDMMQQTSHFNYMENDNLKMLELPYEGDRLSMFIVLPKKVDGLKSVEQNISSQMLNGCFSQLKSTKVRVTLPKFKLETSYNLNSSLKQMGMPSAFNHLADFSGISGKDDLFISNVLHKAFVETDEEGTEAAAATVIIFETKCCMRELPETFNADRPFIFFIKDKLTDLILFMGRINNPEA